MKVKSYYEEYFVNVKYVVEVEEHNKIIQIPFSTKSTHWHKDETNCKSDEVWRRQKMISPVKFDENLNLTYVYSY